MFAPLAFILVRTSAINKSMKSPRHHASVMSHGPMLAICWAALEASCPSPPHFVSILRTVHTCRYDDIGVAVIISFYPGSTGLPARP